MAGFKFQHFACWNCTLIYVHVYLLWDRFSVDIHVMFVNTFASKLHWLLCEVDFVLRRMETTSQNKLSTMTSREYVECGLSIIGPRICIYITLFQTCALVSFWDNILHWCSSTFRVKVLRCQITIKLQIGFGKDIESMCYYQLCEELGCMCE